VVFAYSPTGARAQAAAPTPPSAQAAAKANRASAANGKAVFLRIGCQSCHGTVGQGGAGARLAPSTLPFDAFRTWVRSGTPGWTIARGMPAFPASVVTDDELADVRAYLASLPPPPGPDRIPLLRP
jgi:mono/diheme cytochrome c family protein